MGERREDRHSRQATLVRFPADLRDRINAEAEARDVSVNWLVNRIVAEGIDHLVPVEDFTLTRRTNG